MQRQHLCIYIFLVNLVAGFKWSLKWFSNEIVISVLSGFPFFLKNITTIVQRYFMQASEPQKYTDEAFALPKIVSFWDVEFFCYDLLRIIIVLSFILNSNRHSVASKNFVLTFFSPQWRKLIYQSLFLQLQLWEKWIIWRDRDKYCIYWHNAL